MMIYILILLSLAQAETEPLKGKITFETLKKYSCIKYVDRQRKTAFYGKCNHNDILVMSTKEKWILNIYTEEYF